MGITTYLGMFAKSPIHPLQKHMDKVLECSRLLVPFLEAVNAQQWEKATELRKSIGTLEHEADDLKRELRMTLPKGLFMAVERTDLLELVTTQDKIANRTKHVAGRMLARQTVIPQHLQNDFVDFAKHCVVAVEKATQAINELDELLETGFRGREVDLVVKMVEELDAIEDATDSMQGQLRQGLFEIEKELNPVDVMFLYQFLEWVGEVADHAERVGARLELMLARS